MNLKDAFKVFSWLSLVVTGVALIVWALIFKEIGHAIGVGILAACTWGVWGAFLSWLFGVRRRIGRHLGFSLKSAVFLEKEISASRVADVRRGLETLFKDKGGLRTHRYGVVPGYSLALLQDGNTEIKPLQWSTYETQPGRYETFPTNAVYLLHHLDQPFAIHLHALKEAPHAEYLEEPETTAAGKPDKLQVFAGSLEDAVRIIEYVMRMASVGSVYRGKMLHVFSRGPGAAGQSVRVSDRPHIDAGRIVLPPEVLEVVRRTLASRLKFHRLLERHGHSSKTGILLHGSPGTGKSLVAKHLIGACESHTAIVPTGMETETIREAFRLAVYLQPAMIVIEDVDLLAQRRETNANVTGLQELLNELDGLSSTTEAVVVMTTNRPEVLEPALAARPGRVSQAICFPLPDAALRDRLLRLFTSQAETSAVHFPTWIERTDGASPAFVEELAKKAILFAAERLADPWSEATLHLTDADFDQAIHELLVFGGEMTSNILGFPQAALQAGSD